MSPFLQVSNLSIKSNDVTLINNISFSLTNENPLIILGQTGSGKSLLLKFIMGTLDPKLHVTGQFFISGNEIPYKQRSSLWGKTLSILPQEPSQTLSPLMKGHAQISEVYRYVNKDERSLAQKKAHQSLENYGLGEHANKRPYELSGGMAQRLAMCITSAGHSDLLLVDEPSKGLDIARRDEMITHLKHRAKDGGLCVVTHDIEVARGLGGSMIVIQKGELVEQGDTQIILGSPTHSYTKTLLASVPERWAQPHHQHKTSAPILSIRNLTLHRGNRCLFTNLNLRLHAGEVIGVVGKSGSGKSSLGDVILGLINTYSGTIERFSYEMKKPHWLKIFQDPIASLPSQVTLGQLLDDLILCHQINRQRIPDMMETLRLSPELLHLKPHQASGGELQRFSILRTLLLDPIFLFADEPTSRLDPVVAKEVSTMLITLAKKQGCGVLIVSHDPKLIQSLSDSVINIEDYHLS